MAFKVAPVFLLTLIFFQVLHHGMLRTVDVPHSSNSLDDGTTTSKITNEISGMMQNISKSLKGIKASMDGVMNTVQEALNSAGQNRGSASENDPSTNAVSSR